MPLSPPPTRRCRRPRVGRAGPVPGGGRPQRVGAAVPVGEVVQQRALVGQAGLWAAGVPISRMDKRKIWALTLRAGVDVGAFGIGQPDGLDRRADAAVQQLQKGAVQPGVDRRIGVAAGAAPGALAVDVLHQQPGALAAGVVDVGVGVALVDHQKFGVGAVYLQGDGAAHLLGSQSRCHGKTSFQNSRRASAWFQTPAAVRLARVPRSASKGCWVISAPLPAPELPPGR